MGRKRDGNGSGANLGLEEKLWVAAGKMPGHLEPSEHKHIALGLVSLKYVTDAVDDRRSELVAAMADPANGCFTKDAEEDESVLEDRDEYAADNAFWIPQPDRWSLAAIRDSLLQKLLSGAVRAKNVTKIVDEEV
jgi:type I restriction enzyme M protein